MSSIQRVAWSVADWAEACSCSRVMVHRLIRQGKLRSSLLGRKRLILTPPEEYVESLATTGSGETI